MEELGDGYGVEVDCMDEVSWNELLMSFRDANIYQTWSYDAIRYGKENLSHIIVKKNNRVVAAAQVRIMKIPTVNIGIAYIRWGPLWRKYGCEDDIEDFGQMVKVLRREYVDHRGLVLRILPCEIEDHNDCLRSVLESGGFKFRRSDYRTLYLNLKQPLDLIRSTMSKSWRKNLRKAEERGFTVIEGTDLGLFESVNRLYQEMLARKRFVPGIKINEYRMLQESLPDNLKMNIMICQLDGEPIAGLVGSAIGDTGIELVAATGNDGLEPGGSYLLRWKMITYLMSRGCQFYNLNGINPKRNPGGYQFKSGLCGKSGLDTRFLGTFESYKNPLSYLVIRFAEMAKIVNYMLKKLLQSAIQS